MFNITFLTLKLIILTFLTAKRQLIHNRTAQRNTWNQNYDFIIVGAGAAGCAVAGRLTENPNITVLLLEAGGAPDALYFDIRPTYTAYNERTYLRWSYYTETLATAGRAYSNSRINEVRPRYIGGTPTTYLRGNHRDYDKWSQKYGAIGWGFNEVLPFFLRAENNTDMKIVENNPGYHAVGGPVQISTLREEPTFFQVLQNIYNRFGFPSIDMNGPNQTGVMFAQQFIDTRGFRSNAYSYVDPNTHPNNLHIITRALVIKVLFNGTTAIGVEFDRNDTSFRVYARKEVILCTGSFNTPQLLMISGIGIKSHLQSFGIEMVTELPVGNNLVEIPVFRFDATITNLSLAMPPRQLNLQQLYQFYFNHSETSLPFLATYSSTSSVSEIDYPNSLTWFMIDANGVDIRIATLLVRVHSKGTVRLQSNSPYIPPKIDLNLLSDPRDFRDLFDLLKSVFKLLETTDIAKYISLPLFSSSGCPDCPGQYLYQCNQGLECMIRGYATGYYIPTGTSRMGALQRDDVVVGPNLKVKNVNNLRICDESIAPEHPNSNIYAVSIMIGEKCAQIIKDCYNLN